VCAIIPSVPGPFWYNYPWLVFWYSLHMLNYLLTYGVEPFLRSCQMCSHSENSQQF
jgi:hypothetical protein